MGKSSKKHKQKGALYSEEQNIQFKKKVPVSIGKQQIKKNKKLAAKLRNAAIVSPTFSTSQEQPKLALKKKNKRNRSITKSEDHNNLPLSKFFDSVANENDYGESQTLTDTKSFFKPEVLKPEECEIQYAKPYTYPKFVANSNLPGRNEDSKIIAKSSSEPDDVEDVDCVELEKLDMETHMEEEYHRNMEDTFIEQSNLQFHRLAKNKYIVEMKHGNNLYIRGQLKVQALFGSVEILGWRVNDTTDKSVTVFSPRGCSLLSLEPLEHSSEKLDQVGSELTALGMDSSLAAELVDGLDETSSLVIFERSESTLVSFLGQHVPSISLYPRSLETSGRFLEIESVLNCQILSNAQGRCHQKSQDWEELAELIANDFLEKGRSRVVVCGGKGVGKSTLLRFLVNRSVQAHGAVLYLDFDPGQSEFTVPGCVSVIRVTEPVLGPNYTHVLTPERSVYLGHIDISRCPDQFIQSVQHIIDYCQSIPELTNMVWLVNTMGFPRDLGAELNLSVIGLAQPTRVVQIVSVSPRRNYATPLRPENVLDGRGRWCPPPEHLDFKLYQLQSMAETGEQSEWGLEARITRNFLLLAYFHKMLDKPEKSLSDIIPYRTSLSRLSLSVLHEVLLPTDVLSVMNAALVALCQVGADADVLTPDDEALPRVLAKPHVCPCLGFGVVRGIDVSSRTLYLTTPLAPSRLAAVDCLTTGTIPLPPLLLLNPVAGPGIVPYVVTGPGQITSRLVAKKFIVPRPDKD